MVTADLKFDLIADDMLVSARKYKFNSYLRVNWANYKAMRSFHKGVSPEIIKKEYHQMLNHPTEQRKVCDERTSKMSNGKF